MPALLAAGALPLAASAAPAAAALGPLGMLGAVSPLLSGLGGLGGGSSSAMSSASGYASMNNAFVVGGGGGTSREVGDSVRSIAPWVAVALVAVVFLRKGGK